MPIYEYQCDACGQTSEVLQKVNEKPLETCSKCGDQGVKRKTSLNTFKLNGDGWYRDGYGGKSSQAVV